MFELIKVSERDHYIESPAKAGLIRLGGGEVCLIDSGSDKDAGRKARQILDANKWKLNAIYNTHSHADHVGGNKYLQAQTGCRIFAPLIESAFVRTPVLEPSFLYGSNPPNELRIKFLMAQESEVSPITESDLPEGVELIPLPGHSYDMTGYRTADGTVYLADCLCSRETLSKYQVAFIYDVGAYIDTLERVKVMDGSIFIPSHAAAAENIAPLAQYNIDTVCGIAEKIAELCAEPVIFETLLQKLFGVYGIAMSFQQYALVGCTLRAYLTYLKEQGRVEVLIEDNMLLWHRK